MRLMITDENGTIRYYEQRASGRTRAILTKAMQSPLNTVLFLAPTYRMAQYHKSIFVSIIEEAGLKYKSQNGRVYLAGMTFLFEEESWLENETNLRGIGAIDIYRDHT